MKHTTENYNKLDQILKIAGYSLLDVKDPQQYIEDASSLLSAAFDIEIDIKMSMDFVMKD